MKNADNPISGISRRIVLLGAAVGATAMLPSTIVGAANQQQSEGDAGTGELAGKRVLVTGASRGIGAGIALMLADRGADIALTYLLSADIEVGKGKAAGGVVRSIEAKGRRVVAIEADCGDPDAVRRSVDETVQTLGGIDILVNNVGIARSSPLAEMSPEDINDLLNVNARSAVLASRTAIPHLRRGGRIITIGSCLAERVPYPNLTVYSMSKSALLAFTRGLARELGPQDITVNLVQPGPIDTDQKPADGEWGEPNRRLTSLGRYGEPGDIAAVVAFLASHAAHFMTGSVVTVDAGLNA